MAVSPSRLIAAVVAAQQTIAGLPDDEKLRIDTIEGETELFEILDRYAERAIADRAMADIAAEKAKSHKARAERSRQIILQILQAVELNEPLRRPLYTASLAHHSTLQIISEAELPAQYWHQAPDRVAIERALRAGAYVPGATLGNAESVLLLKVR